MYNGKWETIFLTVPLFCLVFSLDSLTEEALWIKGPVFSITTLILLAYYLFSGRRISSKSPVRVPLALLLAWILISNFRAEFQPSGWRETLNWVTPFLYALMFSGVASPVARTRSIDFLAWSATTVAIMGILQYYGLFDGFKLGVLKQWQGDQDVITVFGNPNFTAEFLVILIPFFLYRYFAEGRLVNLFPVLTGLITVVFTRSRAGLAGTCVAILMVAIWNSKQRWKNIVTISGLLVVVAAWQFPLLEAQVKETRDGFRKGFRLTSYYSSMEMWKERWLAGFGTGQFATYYPLFDQHKREGRFLGLKTNAAHNDFLQVAVEYGTIGLVLFLGLIILAAIRNRALLPILSGILIQAFFNFPLQLAVTRGLFALMVVGILVATGIRERRTTRPGYFTGSIVLFCSLGYLLIMVRAESAQALYNLGRKNQEAGRNVQAVAMLKKSVIYDYYNGEAWANLGVAGNSLGREDEFVRSSREAFRLRPYEDFASLNYALSLYKEGIRKSDRELISESVARARRALRLSPARPQVREFWKYLGGNVRW